MSFWIRPALRVRRKGQQNFRRRNPRYGWRAQEYTAIALPRIDIAGGSCRLPAGCDKFGSHAYLCAWKPLSSIIFFNRIQLLAGRPEENDLSPGTLSSNGLSTITFVSEDMAPMVHRAFVNLQLNSTCSRGALSGPSQCSVFRK